MKDIQNHKDDRNIDIDQVGVKDIQYPITVLDKNMGEQQTVAKINMYVNPETGPEVTTPVQDEVAVLV